MQSATGGAEMEEFRSGGDRLRYRTMGAGPTVFLLHPTPADHQFWIPAARLLQDRYRLILPDLRGHGRSEAGQGEISMARLAEDVERLMDLLGLRQACFAGCSVGAYVLYELWRRCPERVTALAFCCGKPQADSAATREKRQENIAKIAQDGVDEFFSQALTVLVSHGFAANHPAKVRELRITMDAVTPQAAIAIQQGLMNRPDSTPTVAAISVPLLALAGEEDTLSSPAEMMELAKLSAQAEFRLLPGLGHFAPYEDPETVSGILKSFFDRALAGAAPLGAGNTIG